MNCKDNENTAGCSRRQFFGKVGLATMAGVAATTVGPALLNTNQANAAKADATVDTPKFPYKKLDPKDVMARTHAGYYVDS